MSAPDPSPTEQAVIDRFGMFDEEALIERAANWLCKEYGELLNGDADAPPGYWEFQARELLEALRPADVPGEPRGIWLR